MLASFMVVLAIVLLVLAAPVHRYSGPSFTFGPPKAINLVEGGEMVEREVKFPNFLPLQWSVTFSSVTPLFKVGDVIEVDLSLLKEQNVDERSIRIDGKPVDAKGKDISASYFFNLVYPHKLPENSKQTVRIKIDHVASGGTIAHHQKQDSGEEWFWLRETCQATLLLEA